jgi:hypothetical protein
VTSATALDSEQTIRRAYQSAEDNDLEGRAASFTEDGGLPDQSIGDACTGPDERPQTVVNDAPAFPDLRVTVVADWLAQTRAQVTKSGWVAAGSLGAGGSLAREPDGNLTEFVERAGETT